ncbi:hypothetical protein NQ317_000632, partial [Molorchus minor]
MRSAEFTETTHSPPPGKYTPTNCDVVLLDHQSKTMFVIEFSIPAEKNIVLKEDEKWTKYCDLLFEFPKVVHQGHIIRLLVLVIDSLVDKLSTSYAIPMTENLPFLQWSKGYNVDKAISDLVAGITVGLTLIPQSLAYASLAGLEPQYGLYSSLCGGLIYLIFGAVAELSIAPTALLSLMTYSYTKDLPFSHVQGAILLCFIAGCLELLCGVLHLGGKIEQKFKKGYVMNSFEDSIDEVWHLQMGTPFVRLLVFHTYCDEYAVLTPPLGSRNVRDQIRKRHVNRDDSIQPRRFQTKPIVQYTTTDSLYWFLETGIWFCNFCISNPIDLKHFFLSGFLVDFVSTPVVAGFTTAGALTIASSQVKNLFGVQYQSEQFLDTWTNFFMHIKEVKKMDTILGLCCCVVLLSMRKLKDYGAPPLADLEKGEKVSPLKKIIWFLSVSRNALVVIVCAVTAYFLDAAGEKPFSLTTKVPSGWPNVSLPAFHIEKENTTLTFADITSELGTGIIVIPFIAIIANVGIAKAFSQGKVLDASQEMVAVGVCNIVGSFFGSYPVNASFSRAAVGGASGVKTPLAGVYTAVMVFLAFSLLTPYFSYIPKPTLSAVIICAVIFMVEITTTKKIWAANKLDLIPLFITLISCLLLGIEMGILIGILVEVLKYLYVTARPNVLVEKKLIEKDRYYIKVMPTSSILFPSAEHVREKILSHNIETGDNCNIVIIDCHRVTKLDFTSAMCLGVLLKDLRKIGKKVAFYQLKVQLVNILQTVCDSDIVIFQTEQELQDYLFGLSVPPRDAKALY